jgi:hypothetical protein
MVANEYVTVQGLAPTRLHEKHREIAIVGRFPVLDIVNLNLFLESLDELAPAQPQPQTDCWLPLKKRMLRP